MFLMYDDVNLALIPNGPHAVGCYRNGRYANETEARARFPHARILPISVGGLVACDCYDIENGDYHPDQVPELYSEARAHGIWRPCFYANLSTMPAVKHELEHVQVQRNTVRLWVAAYDGVSIVPAGYDAKQFTDRALGRSLDESICLDTFFPPLGPPKAQAAKAGGRVSVALVEHDSDSGEWAIHPQRTENETAG